MSKQIKRKAECWSIWNCSKVNAALTICNDDTNLIIRWPVGNYVRFITYIVLEVDCKSLWNKNSGWSSHSIQYTICSEHLNALNISRYQISDQKRNQQKWSSYKYTDLITRLAVGEGVDATDNLVRIFTLCFAKFWWVTNASVVTKNSKKEQRIS